MGRSVARNSVATNFKKCVKRVKKVCGSKSFKSCLKVESKENAQVAECRAFLLENHGEKGVSLKGLNPSMVKEVMSAGVSNDQKKCFALSRKLCKEGEALNRCMKRKAGSFPSFCQGDSIVGVRGLEKSIKNDRKLSRCTTSIAKRCQLRIPAEQIKPDPAAYKAALARYEICLKAQVGKEKDCSEVTDPKKGGGATQLID